GVATLPHPKGGRLPSGVGGRDKTANRREAALQKCRRGCNPPGRGCCPPGFILGAGTTAVKLRVCPSPRGAPRPVKEVSSDGGAGPDRTSQGRCPMLEL